MNAIVNLEKLYKLLEDGQVNQAIVKSLCSSVKALFKANKFVAFVAGGALGLGVCAAVEIEKLKDRVTDLECRLESLLDISKEDDCR